MTNNEFDEIFIKESKMVVDSFLECIAHNDLSASLRTLYSEMIDSYQKDGIISTLQAENFTFNGQWS